METLVSNEQLDQGLAKIFGIKPDQAGVNLEAIRLRAATALDKYGRTVAELFARQSVPVPPPVHLQWWAEGSRVQVVNAHPDRERIEVILNGHGDVVEDFKELELLHEILRNTELAGAGTTADQHFSVGITSSGPIAFFSE
ncbi:hypothetical protein [Chitinimonas lacunae]|uniref:Uncharacterized protein n=1 Tax=Chitinimonas lacunae TaxID=1963018 RepID=A0ABV8MN48_9NEIS